MERTHPSRVLVVSDKTAATPALLEAVRNRVREGPAQFLLLVPNPAPAEWHPFHPERRDKVEQAERVLLRALPAIQDAVGGAVRGRVSIRHEPMDAVQEMLHDEPFDEIIVSTAPREVRRWLHVDLPRRLSHLGLRVTSVLEDER
jgi:hypothetical protein